MTTNRDKVNRIKSELKFFELDPAPGIMMGQLAEDDHDHYWATISGPEGSPYEGGMFELMIELGEKYPYKPPRVNFQT